MFRVQSVENLRAVGRLTRSQKCIGLTLALQRHPRTFDQIVELFPYTSARTLWRLLADVRLVAGLDVDKYGRYRVPLHLYTDGEGGKPWAAS